MRQLSARGKLKRVREGMAVAFRLAPLSTAHSRVAIANGPEHCKDVFQRRIALNVVNRIEDESTAVVKNLDALADFAVNVVGSSKWKAFLRVNATTPEDQILAEFPLEVAGVHLRR